LEKVDELKRGPFEADLAVPDGSLERVSYTYDELDQEYNRLKERKSSLLAERVRLLHDATALRRERDAYLAENLDGLTEVQMRALQRKIAASPAIWVSGSPSI
jgi:hypothetical protein